MEDIQVFEIDININDRIHLYDYVTRSLLRRPASGKWNAEAFRSLGVLDDLAVEEGDDAAVYPRVSLLDDMICDALWLETTVPMEHRPYCEDNSFKTWAHIAAAHEDGKTGSQGVSPCLPRRVLPVYTPGEVISGSVHLKLRRDLSAQALTLNFKGYAHTRIRIYGAGHHDVNADEVYADETLELWHTSKGKSREKSHANAGTMPYQTVTSEMLEAGQHTFSFSLPIPKDARRSVPPLVARYDNQAFLVHRLKATIDKGNPCSRGNILTHKGVWVEQPFDLADVPACLKPLFEELIKTTGPPWNSGKIALHATVATSGVVRGEPVALTLEIDNKSGRDIQRVEALVHLKGRARVSLRKGVFYQPIHVRSDAATFPGVAKGYRMSQKIKIPWKFTKAGLFDGNVLPVANIPDCKILSVNYQVEIKVIRKGVYRDVTLTLPITVGNCCSKGPDDGPTRAINYWLLPEEKIAK